MRQGEFAQFLRHLLAYYPGKQLLVIHDRGAQHKGSRIAEVVREAAGRLVLKPQPAYSPEFNPQERIWNGCGLWSPTTTGSPPSGNKST